MPRNALGDRPLTDQCRATGPPSRRSCRIPAGDPLPASDRPTQPRPALARRRRRTRHPAKRVRTMVRGVARKPSRGRYRRGIAGDRRSRSRRTDRHRATARLRARLSRRCRCCLTGRSRLCTDYIRPAGAPPPRPTSIGTAGRDQIGIGGRHQSECPADIIGIRRISVFAERTGPGTPAFAARRMVITPGRVTCSDDT
jgi:hypothetical protein